MTEIDNNAAVDHTPAISSPGKRLRQAREASGLSSAEAATKLHLHQRMLEALENDDYEQLPAAIYVRGYLRNYARLVGVDAQEIVAAYDGSDSQHPELKPPLKAPSQASSSDKPVKAVTYLITLGLVLLLLAWWQSRHLSEESAIDLETLETGVAESGKQTGTAGDNTTENRASESLGYPIRTVKHPDTPFYPLPASPAQTTADGGQDTATASGVERNPAGTMDTATTPVEVLEAEPETAQTEASATAGNNETAAPADAAETAAAAAEKGLRLDINEESWVEVYDASGKRLYLGLAKPGETIQVSGETPLRVLLGYAPGVQVHFNGETIDTVEHSRAGVAQFSVGG